MGNHPMDSSMKTLSSILVWGCTSFFSKEIQLGFLDEVSKDYIRRVGNYVTRSALIPM